MRILFVDDSNADRILFRMMLKEIDSSIEYINVGSGAAAIEYLSSAEILPDYIFLDVDMPGMGGIECLSQLKKNEPWAGIPVIVYSVAETKTYANLARELGATKYLRKSIDFDKSVKEISAIIRT